MYSIGHFGETPSLMRWLEEEKDIREQHREHRKKKPLETKAVVSRAVVGRKEGEISMSNVVGT